MVNRKIYFDEELHKYTDELSNPYTSVTTIISKYYEGFKTKEMAERCAKIGRNPSHAKYLKYKGKSAKQLIYEWENTKNVACEKGTKKHNYFETIIREGTNYNKIKNNYTGNRIYTIEDVINDNKIGRLDLSYFEQQGIKQKYPVIYNIIKDLVSAGFLIYAEIGVYDPINMICGLIDIILIRNNEFIILDWKTNAAPIKFESGYFVKDNYGNLTEEYILNNHFFYHPLDYVPASTGHKYSMQLSGYAELVESFGFVHKGSILCHIRTVSTNKFTEQDFDEVKIIQPLDLKKDFKLMKEHHTTISKVKEIDKLEPKLF